MRGRKSACGGFQGLPPVIVGLENARIRLVSIPLYVGRFMETPFGRKYTAG